MDELGELLCITMLAIRAALWASLWLFKMTAIHSGYLLNTRYVLSTKALEGFKGLAFFFTRNRGLWGRNSLNTPLLCISFLSHKTLQETALPSTSNHSNPIPVLVSNSPLIASLTNFFKNSFCFHYQHKHSQVCFKD